MQVRVSKLCSVSQNILPLSEIYGMYTGKKSLVSRYALFCGKTALDISHSRETAEIFPILVPNFNSKYQNSERRDFCGFCMGDTRKVC